MTVAQDHGLFGPRSVTWRVHLEPVLIVAGIRALILQSLHPRVMRGTYQNSVLFDPRKAWARFERTVEFVGTRTFGSLAEVEKAGARVRGLHASMTGYDPDTDSTFPIDEPAGLLWVHATEIDSYAEIARRAGLLDRADEELYLAESVRAAHVVGLDDAPGSRAEMDAYFAAIRPQLAVTDEALRAVGNLFAPRGKAPVVAKAAVPVVASVAMGTLPRWARRMFGLPGLPTTDLGVTVALRTLRGVGDLLPDIPAPPNMQRARQLVREARQAPVPVP